MIWFFNNFQKNLKNVNCPEDFKFFIEPKMIKSITVKIWIKLPNFFEPIVMPWYDKTGKNGKNLQLKKIAESECICKIYAQIRDAKIMIALQ